MEAFLAAFYQITALIIGRYLQMIDEAHQWGATRMRRQHADEKELKDRLRDGLE
jgi:hypothetical protein